MAINMHMGLAQKQTQKLVMTQAYQQAIKLLQLNHMELAAAIEQELMENPALEESSDGGEEITSEAEDRMVDELRHIEADAAEQSNGIEGSTDRKDLERLLERFESTQLEPGPAGSSGQDELPPIETNLRSSENLAQHLLHQLGMTFCTEEERHAAVVIIYNLDRNGYLELSLEAVAEEAGVDLDAAEGAKEIVQGLDPVGCGSLDHVEALRVQAKRAWPEDPTFDRILLHHLEDLEARSYHVIAKSIGQDVEDVVEYHKMIQQLSPRPGLPYADEQDHYVSPDVEVVKKGDSWQILQNDDGLPHLHMNAYYRQIVDAKGSSKEDLKYVKERLEAAEFLIRSIYKRQRTIHKVVECIIERQQEFFDHGPEHLKPMVLREIADQIGVHESTVSRVTSGKYMQCPQGLFELKYFFNAGIARNVGGDLAGEAVKLKIRKLVSDEDPKNPLSDNELVDLLAREDITIARRTVAKYREAMGILTSTKRKRLF